MTEEVIGDRNVFGRNCEEKRRRENEYFYGNEKRKRTDKSRSTAGRENHTYQKTAV